jgi:hypothetical protein
VKSKGEILRLIPLAMWVVTHGVQNDPDKNIPPKIPLLGNFLQTAFYDVFIAEGG